MSIKGSAESHGELRGYLSMPDTIEGSAESYVKMRGSLFKPYAIVGRSAYEIAVAHGFNGTEEEWLESLKARFTEEDILAIIDAVSDRIHPARIGEVTIYADGWIGDDSPYAQIVEIEGVTENSQVDLTPSVEQLAVFHHKDLAFVTENDGGVVTVYAIGQKPQNDYTIQVTITEVDV